MRAGFFGSIKEADALHTSSAKSNIGCVQSMPTRIEESKGQRVSIILSGSKPPVIETGKLRNSHMETISGIICPKYGTVLAEAESP